MRALLEKLRLPDLLEAAGAVCVGVFLACWWAPMAAWLVAGVALILKAFELDTRGAPPRDSPALPERASKPTRGPG